MYFAHPWALALFALFVPVILLYLLRQRRRHVQVSSLLFWERILHEEHRVTAYTRLRKILSLLLQLLLISLLVLALARPLFAKELLGARRIVILIDASASMTAREGESTRFALAVEHARAIVRSMASGDSAMLVAFADAPEVLAPSTSSRTALRAALDRAAPTHRGTDLAAALALLPALPPSPRKTQVHLLTDAAYPPLAFAPPEAMDFAIFQIGTATENVGITAFQARPLPDSPRDVELLFEVLNAGMVEVRAAYEVRAGERLVDAGELLLRPGARESRLLRQFAREGGELTLFVDHDDAFPLDNTAYAVVPAVRPIAVTLVTEGNLFLVQALATDPGVVLTVLAPGAYDVTPNAADVVIFDRVVRPAPEDVPSIHLGAWPPEFGLVEQGLALDLLVTSWERAHRVNRHLRLDNITIREAVRVEAHEEFAPLVQSFDDALVLCTRSRPLRLVLTFDTTASDLPLRAAYPLLIANSVRHLAGVDTYAIWTSPRAGDLIGTEALAAALDAGEPIWRILAPDEALEALSPPPNAPALSPTAMLADRVGIYRGAVLAGGTRPLFAANLGSEAESHIRPAPGGPFANPEDFSQIDAGFRLGLEPHFFLLLLAVFLLCAEWLLFHRRILE